MNIIHFCKFKQQRVVLNECNADCICAMCDDGKCVIRFDRGIKYDYSTCQEYYMSKIDKDYSYDKQRKCRMCLHLSNLYFARRKHEKKK